MKRSQLLACTSLVACAPFAARAQSAPNWSYGYVPSAAEVRNTFATKQDRLTFSPLNQAGGTMSGKLQTPAATVNGAGFSVLPGSAPASPANGDMWITGSGWFAQVGGQTIQVPSFRNPTFTGTATAPTLALTGTASSGNLSGAAFASPSGAPYSAPLTQILGATYNLAQEGRWGASQADNDRIFGAALARSANTSIGPVTIDVPMGTWTFTVPQTLTTTKPFKLRCAGRGQTRIIVGTGASSLLTLTQQTVGAQVSVEGCEFSAASAATGTPLKISFTGSASGPSPYYQYSSLSLRDLSFVGQGNTSTTGTNYFVAGYDVSNAWQPIVSSVHFTGAVEARRGATAGGIFRYSFAEQVHDFFAQYAVYGLYLPGGATNSQNDQGFAWHSGEAVDVDYGISAMGTNADPWFAIGPVHINAGKSCVQTVYKSQLDLARILCYKLAGDTNDFNAFDIQNAAYGNIGAIQIADSRASNLGGAFTGIKLTNSTGITINGVQAQGWQNNTGSVVYLAGTTDQSRIKGVDATPVTGLTAIGYDASIGSGNRFFDLMPAVTQGLTVNSATPSVGNDRSGMWTTANSSATSITNFTNSFPSQKITIFFQDAVTTIVHGTPIRLKGSTSATPPAGGTITLLNLGSYWVETARSF